MKNNRGQVLIVFVLMLPIFFMLSGLIIDSGFLFIDKRKVDYAVKDAVTYGLDNLDIDRVILQSKLRKIIYKNIDDVILLDIEIKDSSITIELKKKKDSIFTIVYSDYRYDIATKYYGYNHDGKIVVRKE